MKLRGYQHDAMGAILRAWQDYDSTLLVLPTGCGKTVVFTELLKQYQAQRTLILTHRGELTAQAVRTANAFGLEADIEQADLYADTKFWNDTPVVVSTIQTQIAGNNGGRMRRFDPHDFGLVICDEAHHFVAKSFRRVLEYYRQNENLKVLGVTATPDRADEEALGQVFQSVAYVYDLLDAINDGWLVPITQQMVTIEGLDFSQIRTTAGDLNGVDLAIVMEAEKTLHGVVSASMDIIGERPALVFAVSVRQAERYAEIFNRHRPHSADWVCGATEKAKRHEIFRDFNSGKTQILVNVGVATEGYDNPRIQVIVQARPTKSRCLYSQMIGRATRPVAGLVDRFDTAEQRQAAIAASEKPSCLVIDFAGNSGRHKLITTADILGGKTHDEEVIERAKEEATKEGEPVRMDQLLDGIAELMAREAEERRKREAARRAHLIARAQYTTKTVNPFDVFQLKPANERGWDRGRNLSEKQRNLLLRQGIDPKDMPYAQAKQLIDELFRRWDSGLATMKQCALLRRHGYDTKNVTMKQASELIDALAANHWRRPAHEMDQG